MSRSFYLTLRVLPASVRKQIGLAYLLARIADTISDTPVLPPEERLLQLLLFRKQVQGSADPGLITPIGPLAAENEILLLQEAPQLVALLNNIDATDRQRIRSVVTTLTEGMEMDLTNFPPEASGELRAIENRSDLDRYLYLVAGCVGAFWTSITIAHEPKLRQANTPVNECLGVRFGKALQLTNVIRDVPRDLQFGRCYLPADELAERQIRPTDLLHREYSNTAWPIIKSLMELALSHYSSAEDYLVRIPRGATRLRLAALWPIAIGLSTLDKLARTPQWLDPEQSAKIGRSGVYGIVARSLVVVQSNTTLCSWIRRLHRSVEHSIAARKP